MFAVVGDVGTHSIPYRVYFVEYSSNAEITGTLAFTITPDPCASAEITAETISLGPVVYQLQETATQTLSAFTHNGPSSCDGISLTLDGSTPAFIQAIVDADSGQTIISFDHTQATFSDVGTTVVAYTVTFDNAPSIAGLSSTFNF